LPPCILVEALDRLTWSMPSRGRVADRCGPGPGRHGRAPIGRGQDLHTLPRGRVCRRASWSRPSTRSPGRCRRGASRGRVVDRCGPGTRATRGGAGSKVFRAARQPHQPKFSFGANLGGGGGCRDCRRHVHHAAGLSIGVDQALFLAKWSRPSLRWPACRRRSARARPEILEHGPPGRGPRFAGQHAGDDRPGHGRRSWNTVHQVKALALLTTRPGCRSEWTAAGAIGTAGDPGTRPPGQGPRFAGQHAGDTFTTRPGCRSVWTAAGAIGTAGDPGTRSTRSRPSLCSPRGRAVDRCGRPAARSPRAPAVDRPRVPSARPEILEHVHRVEALALLASMPATIDPGGRGS
jgi:hypothetical protein